MEQQLADSIRGAITRALEQTGLASRLVPVSVVDTSTAVETTDGTPALTVSWRGADVPASYLAGLTFTPGELAVAVKTGPTLLVIGKPAGVRVDD